MINVYGRMNRVERFVGGLSVAGLLWWEIWGWMHVRSDKFFRIGWGYDEPPVLLIEDDCAA